MEDVKFKYKYHVLVSILSYLIISFVKWDITWICGIPSYDWVIRLLILIIFILVHGAICALYNDM